MAPSFEPKIDYQQNHGERKSSYSKTCSSCFSKFPIPVRRTQLDDSLSRVEAVTTFVKRRKSYVGIKIALTETFSSLLVCQNKIRQKNIEA